MSSRAQEPQGHGSLRQLQRGRVDNLAGPLHVPHAHGHPHDQPFRQRSFRRSPHQGRRDQSGPLPARDARRV